MEKKETQDKPTTINDTGTEPEINDEHNEFVIKNYNEWIEKRDGISIMGYGSEISQDKRFKALFRIGDMTGKTILDVGCGRGDLARKAIQNGHIYKSYLGTDIVPKMIEIANTTNNLENTEYRVMDILTPDKEFRFDYVIMCGPLNLKQPDTQEMAKKMITKAFEIANIAVGFNMTSSWGHKELETPQTHYFNPIEILEFCRTLTRDIVFDHTYLPHDFTIFLYKDNKERA